MHTLMHSHAVIMKQWATKGHVLYIFLSSSAAAAPEDPRGPGSGSADIKLQLGGQWAAQDTAEDPQEQPCEFLTLWNVLRAKFAAFVQAHTVHVMLSCRDTVTEIYYGINCINNNLDKKQLKISDLVTVWYRKPYIQYNLWSYSTVSVPLFVEVSNLDEANSIDLIIM